MRMRWEFVAEWCNVKGYRNGAELGVKEGRFSRFILENVPDSRMICVDTWEQLPNDHEDYSGWDFNRIESYFDMAVGEYRDRVMVFKMRTDQAVSAVQDNLLDFIFVDADHSYKGVKRDIVDWKSKVRTGGMICGHDIDLDGVKKAVEEEFGEYETGPDKVWCVWK